MKIVSWHPVLTDHQSYTLAALQHAGDCDLKVYVANTEHAEREAQGWVNQHASSLSPELIPKKGWIRFAVQRLRQYRDAVHLFGSPFEQTKLIFVLLLAIALRRKVYLISEPYSPISFGYLSDKRQYLNWLKVKLRPLLYYMYGVLMRCRIDGVFAISILAIVQYQSIGIAREKIFPFGYFIPYQEQGYSLSSSVTSSGKSGFKIVFVGSLIARKGLDILIEAVRHLNSDGMSVLLDVYGPGDPNRYIFDQSKVRYCGTIPFGNSQAVISEYDVLVLPSRYDGWGVVINEAILAGVPVVCSSQVGSAALIQKWQCGVTFASEDEIDLVNKLKELIINRELFDNMRIAACKAGDSLEPKVAGKYMYDIINQDAVENGMRKKIECPWYECS